MEIFDMMSPYVSTCWFEILQNCFNAVSCLVIIVAILQYCCLKKALGDRFVGHIDVVCWMYLNI